MPHFLCWKRCKKLDECVLARNEVGEMRWDGNSDLFYIHLLNWEW